MKKYVAEFIGTFFLIFIGTGSIIVDQDITLGKPLGLIGIALVWGITVSAVIYTFGGISGAHMNPAVTITFWIIKLFKTKDVAPYILSQLAGAFSASLVLHMLFPENKMLGTTQPLGEPIQSFILEIIIAFVLMTVILFTAHGSKETGILAGLAVGGTILVLVLFAGPISGTSINPTRSMAPAIVSGNLKNLWIYLTAPFLGMILAGICWKWMHHSK